MMWCNNCKEAVEPGTYNEYDIPDINAGGYRKTRIDVCPFCGQEVYQEPGTCVMCRELIAPGKSLCDPCADCIGEMIDGLAEVINVSRDAVLDGLAEYLNMEDR